MASKEPLRDRAASDASGSYVHDASDLGYVPPTAPAPRPTVVVYHAGGVVPQPNPNPSPPAVTSVVVTATPIAVAQPVVEPVSHLDLVEELETSRRGSFSFQAGPATGTPRKLSASLRGAPVSSSGAQRRLSTMGGGGPVDTGLGVGGAIAFSCPSCRLPAQLCGCPLRTAFGVALALLVVVCGVSVGMYAQVQGFGLLPPSPTMTPTTSPSPTATVSSSASASGSASPSVSMSSSKSPEPSGSPYFSFWNGNGGANYSAWWDPLDVNINMTFPSRTLSGQELVVQVDWADHFSINLFASPEYIQSFDDGIRAWNSNASLYSGNIDSCGFPLDPNGLGFSRRTNCFYEDFSQGFDDSRLQVAQTKSCCAKSPVYFPNFTYYPADDNRDFGSSFGVEEADVEYPPGVVRRKNVLRLTSMNGDNLQPQSCGSCANPADPIECPNCHKYVLSAALVETTDLFASGKYDVIAKVPANSGLIWAMWTFHYEEHIPTGSCDDFGCYTEHYHGLDPTFSPQQYWNNCCGEGCCADKNRPPYCPPEPCPCCKEFKACPNDTLCDTSWSDQEQQCASTHAVPDSQFTGNSSINSWKTQVNHEIDIEIPANCMDTSVCAQTSLNSENFTQRLGSGCISRYNTANLNNYLFATNGGTGPAYSNMCVGVFEKNTSTSSEDDKGEPFALIGDGKYHKYTIDWHSGGVKRPDGSVTPGHVDFYVDDIFMGSNNVFVPTRASRLTFGMWANSENIAWNNWPDDWSGVPGDGFFYLTHAYVSEVKISPHNEPNDIIVPATYDQPDNCIKYYLSPDTCHRLWQDTDPWPPAINNPDPGVLSC